MQGHILLLHVTRRYNMAHYTQGSEMCETVTKERQKYWREFCVQYWFLAAEI